MCQATHSWRPFDHQRAKLLKLAVAICRTEMVESRHPTAPHPFHAADIGGDVGPGRTQTCRSQLCLAGTRSIRLGRELDQPTNWTQQHANPLPDGPRSCWPCCAALIRARRCTDSTGTAVVPDKLGSEAG